MADSRPKIYQMDRITRRATEERVVTINEVDMSQMFVGVQDQFGSKLQVSMHLLDGGITSIPAINEIWTIKRQGNEWFLAKKSDNGTETTLLTSMLPGDKRIETTGTLYLNALSVEVNNVPLLSGLYHGSGVPASTLGNNGEYYFRSDTPTTANQRIYVKVAGAWTGIV